MGTRLPNQGQPWSWRTRGGVSPEEKSLDVAPRRAYLVVAKARPLGRVDGEAGSKKPSLETLGEAQRGQEWTEA